MCFICTNYQVWIQPITIKDQSERSKIDVDQNMKNLYVSLHIKWWFDSFLGVSRIINCSDMSATFYTHDMRHTRSLTLAKFHSGVNLVFQKKATASPPLPILTDQACKPYTRKPLLLVPRGMWLPRVEKAHVCHFLLFHFRNRWSGGQW